MRLILIIALISTLTFAKKKKVKRNETFANKDSYTSVVCLSNQVFDLIIDQYLNKRSANTEVEAFYKKCTEAPRDICKNNNAKICSLKGIENERVETILEKESSDNFPISKINQMYFPFLIAEQKKLKYLHLLNDSDFDILNISTLLKESKKVINIQNCMEHAHEYISYLLPAKAMSIASSKAYGFAHNVLELKSVTKNEIKELTDNLADDRESVIVGLLSYIVQACRDTTKVKENEIASIVCSRYKNLIKNNNHEYFKDLCKYF